MHLIILVALLIATPVLAADLPPDVARFVARRDRCDHFRSEDTEDGVRNQDIACELEINCRGTDTELARLKQRYAHHLGIRGRLERYDSNIE